MSNSDPNEPVTPEPSADDGVEKADCVALVPLIQPAQWMPTPRRCAADSSFVTHLIATAEHVPQTCGLRRASPAEARTAYQAGRIPPRNTGSRTRQVA